MADDHGKKRQTWLAKNENLICWFIQSKKYVINTGTKADKKHLKYWWIRKAETIVDLAGRKMA